MLHSSRGCDSTRSEKRREARDLRFVKRNRKRSLLAGFESTGELEPRLLLATVVSAIQNLPGFTTNSLGRNDDGSSPQITLPFSPDFFGVTEHSAWVNNNGNITFDSALGTYTPFPLNTTNHQIIAPFFADVYTLPSNSGIVTYGTDTINGHAAFGVDYFNVAYYAAGDKLNTFQVILIDRSDTGAGNFDIEMNYGSIQWETGSASGGSDGLGGSSARVGYSNGTLTPGTYFELPGSAVPGSFLDSNLTTGLIYNSIGSSIPGQYIFQARNGVVKQADSFSALSQPTITYGTSTTTLSGQLTSGANIPTGQVEVTVNGVNQFASIDPTTGDFSTVFSTSALGASSSPYTIAYSYPGDSNYSSTSATTTLTVNKANPNITWATPANITYGIPLSSSQLDASVSVPGPDPTIGAITYSPLAGTYLNAGPNQSLTVNVAATANYNAATASVPITVLQATPTIVWAPPVDILPGTPLGTSQLDASVSVPGPDPTIGAITYSPPAGTILPPGPGQTLTVNVAATTNYRAATASVPINVKYSVAFDSLSQPTITYGAASTTVSGHIANQGNIPTGQVEVSLNGVNQFASIDQSTGNFSTVFSTATIGASTTPYPINFNYPGSANFATASSTSTLTVNKATPGITWVPPLNITYGTPLGSTQLDATITAPDHTYGAVTYTPPLGTYLNSGPSQTLTVNVAASANYTAATLSVPITVLKATPLITWPTPAAIVSGTPLSNTQLDAVVTVPGPDPAGAVTYAPPAGTVLPVGNNQTLTVNVAGTSNYNAVTTSVPINVVLVPDLVVSNVTPPLSAFSGTTVSVSWTVLNQGLGTTTAQWTDSIYVANTATPTALTLLGTVDSPINLATNQSYTRTHGFTLPAGISGNYQIVVVADSNNAASEINTSNNSLTSAAFPVTLSPYADLRVSSITAPTTATAGQPITISWDVTNAGTGATDATSWNDSVYISPTPTLNLQTATLLGSVQNQSYLNPGDSYASTLTATLPTTLSGPNYAIVDTNSNNAQYEYIYGNNNATATTMTTQVTPAPAPGFLHVQQVSILTPPSGIYSGSPILVSWTVTNTGSSTIPVGGAGYFDDGLALSQTPNWDGVNGIWLGGHQGAQTTPLAVGASYSYTKTISLPSDISGTWYLVAVPDTHYFAGGNGQIGSGNIPRDQGAAAMQILVPPSPDLQVTKVSADQIGDSGRPINVSWSVSNQGFGATGASSWTDDVYLSSSPTFQTSGSQAATLLGTFTHNGILAPLDSYTQNESVTLPNSISGPYYIFVTTNVGHTVYEYASNYDATANNTTGDPTPVQVILLPPPPPPPPPSSLPPSDLQVTSIVPPTAAQSGQTVLVQWSVANTGPGVTSVSNWSDQVVLSTSANLATGTNVILGTFPHVGALSTKGNYSASGQVTLPQGISGAYYLFVVADSGNLVYEGTNAGNQSASVSLPITLAPSPDLRVSSLTVPGGSSGQPLNIEWTVTNEGVAAVPSNEGSWTDRVYLSSGTAPNPASDPLLGSFTHNGALAPNGFYNQSQTVTLPNGISGPYTIYVITDATNVVYETVPASNKYSATSFIASPGNPSPPGAVTIVQTPPPDLQVSNITAPATSYAGQPVTINWAVTNAGPGSAVPGTWSDTVYLSQDQYFDPTSVIALGSVSHTGGLASNATYNASLTATLPSNISGPYYAIIVADSGDVVYEGQTSITTLTDPNPMTIALPPLTDLAVTGITLPLTGTLGQTPSTPITWTVTNTSLNPAIGTWYDSVYLSPTPTWSVSDPLIDRVEHTGGLVPGASYTGTTSANLPALAPGNYYVIVRADIRDNVRETNKANNEFASPGTIALNLPSLPLNTPTSGTIANTQDEYFRVDVTAGEDLLLSASFAQSTEAEFYVRYGARPRRSISTIRSTRISTTLTSNLRLRTPTPVRITSCSTVVKRQARARVSH